ncbi:GntR family transcriptional regulator [Roseomonas acroporae]|uniref:GntR family transcriptional regulator n=1 Tax=Roseomonas acroporae TaxID=2937791 RepID=UPI0024A76E61|nr:GntR family transcriptional regulator [Roseomonas acroporae]
MPLRLPDSAPPPVAGNGAAEAGQLLAGAQPRYASVATALAADILAGRRRVGELLPTEQELGRLFGVSRSTVREALRRLRELGLVAGSQGVGTRIVADTPRSSYVLAVRSATDIMGYSGRTTLAIRRRDEVVADAAMAGWMGCEAGTRWCHVGGLRLPADPAAPPISCADLYVAPEFAAIAALPEVTTTPVYRLIGQRLGIAVTEVLQEIAAIALAPAQAAALGVAAGSPGLHIRRRFLAAGGRLLEATTNVHAAADRFSYALRLGTSAEVAGQGGAAADEAADPP